MSKRKLDEREKLFAMGLVSGMSAMRSAIEAGYTEQTSKGKSYKWVGKSRIDSNKPHVFDYVERLRAKIEKKELATIQEAMAFHTKVLRSNPNHFYETDGFVLASKALEDMGDWVDAIEEISRTQGGLKIKTYSKHEAAKEIVKILGGYQKDNDQSRPVNNNNFVDLDKLTDEERKSFLKNSHLGE